MEILYINLNPSRMFHPSFPKKKAKIFLIPQNSLRSSSLSFFPLDSHFLCVCYPNLLFLLTSVLHLSSFHIFFFFIHPTYIQERGENFLHFHFFLLFSLRDFYEQFSIAFICYGIHLKPTKTIAKCNLITNSNSFS